jgi:protein-S-isoprenylcysteine O-methyltransferase Ste14
MAIRLLRWLVLAALLVWLGLKVDLPRFWVYLALWCAAALYGSIAADSTLFKERLKPAGRGVDPFTVGALRLLAVAQLVVALFDVAVFHWSDTVPAVERAIAMIVFAGSMALAMRALVANRFFSSAVRVQSDRGHHVVSTGPYAVIRHPGYLGMMIAAPASALALGSWWALVPALTYTVLIGRRVRIEDRFLHEHLDGYPEYAARVRDRLIPGIW